MPVKGFLGTGATFDADVNLVVQLVMGAALVAGVILAKQRCYRAHGVCQTTGAAAEFVNDRTSDVALVPATRESNIPQGPS